MSTQPIKPRQFGHKAVTGGRARVGWRSTIAAIREMDSQFWCWLWAAFCTRISKKKCDDCDSRMGGNLKCLHSPYGLATEVLAKIKAKGYPRRGKVPTRLFTHLSPGSFRYAWVRMACLWFLHFFPKEWSPTRLLESTPPFIEFKETKARQEMEQERCCSVSFP